MWIKTKAPNVLYLELEKIYKQVHLKINNAEVERVYGKKKVESGQWTENLKQDKNVKDHSKTS